MYLIGKDEQLTPDRICKILNQFQTKELPKLREYRHYYCGKHKILKKQYTDKNKPMQNIVVNYCRAIVNNYSGYMTGIPITYSNDEFQDVLDVLRYNDVVNVDNSYLLTALAQGVAYECTYIDEDGKIRFRLFNSEECIPVYDNTLDNNLQYVIRFRAEDLVDERNTNYIVEVYGPNSIVTYRSTQGFNSLTFMNEQPHYFGQVPVTVFSLNDEEKSIFDSVMTLQDGINELYSSQVENIQQFNDCYLILKGCYADDEQLQTMKSNRVLQMDPDASAEYLTKNIKDTQITDMIQNYNDQIYKMSNCVDFTDEKFFSSSGISLQWKMLGMQNISSNIEANMKKALQRRIELISAILNLTNEKMWRDVKIEFHRLTPVDRVAVANELNSYRGLVSNRTILEHIDFITDVDEELKRIKEENKDRISIFNTQYMDDDEE